MEVKPAAGLFDGPNPRVSVYAKALLELLETGSAFRKLYDGELHSLWFDVPWGEIMKLFSTYKVVSHDAPIPSCDVEKIVQYLMGLVKLDEGGVLGVRVPPGMSQVAMEWAKAFRDQKLKVNCLAVQLADSWCNTKCVINSAKASLTRTGHMWLIAHKGRLQIHNKKNFSKYLTNIVFSLISIIPIIKSP